MVKLSGDDAAKWIGMAYSILRSVTVEGEPALEWMDRRIRDTPKDVFDNG